MRGLLHDAAEAYLVDIPRPLKHLLPEYRTLETQVYAVIADRFGIPAELDPAVVWADDRALATEWRELMPDVLSNPYLQGLQPLRGAKPLPAYKAERQFLDLYHKLQS